MRGEFARSWILAREPCYGSGLQWLVAEGRQHGSRDLERNLDVKGFGLIWIRGTACICGQHSGKYGPHGELFFFLLKKEPMVPGEFVEFGPCFSAETVKACALIGLHMTAEEKCPSVGQGFFS